MAQSQVKSGGPNRGRRLVKKMGMGSGKSRAKGKAAMKGKRG
jgi:hypothetical protein